LWKNNYDYKYYLNIINIIFSNVFLMKNKYLFYYSLIQLNYLFIDVYLKKKIFFRIKRKCKDLAIFVIDCETCLKNKESKE